MQFSDGDQALSAFGPACGEGWETPAPGGAEAADTNWFVADLGAENGWPGDTAGLAGGGDGGVPAQEPFVASEAFALAAQQGVASAVYPWSAVVLVQATYPNGVSYWGSGVMVGRNDVLTAGHVVYNPAWGGLASSVTVIPAYVPELGLNGPHGSSYASVTAADTQFDPDGDRRAESGNGGPGLFGSERDLAFLTLQTPLGDRTHWMGLDPTFKQGYANQSGYPFLYGNRLTNDTAYASDDAVDAFTDLRWFETRPGNSGGPIWHYGPDGQPAVVGIVSSGSGGADGARGGAAFDIATSYESILGWITSNDHLIA